ncbi:hypothetical protein [Bremerella alba]|uniref:Uncharacterized protein n=1 Tax=Bremerella alba TaxID=980252 RepID=A0A7V8V716_9BACT|nr:hypothetical protein [Bremerella alba]MBA2116095.1 hypothetical protein [Bremerella alba]
MPHSKLVRIYAYQLSPRRTATSPQAVEGGKFPISSAIRNSLDELFIKSGLAAQAEVDFRLNTGTTIGKHPVRQLLLRFTFGAGTTAAAASRKLSEKLADSMDYRSPPTLLMMTCLRNSVQRRTIMWAFPQESGFQFRTDTAGARIRLLKDIFSHSSRLRKAAMFEGRSRRSGFASGRIIDHQAFGASGAGADYWVDKFLECQFALSGVMGTRRLASYLRSAHDALSTQADKDQIFSTILAIRTSPAKNWTYQRVANRFLSGTAQGEFLSRIPVRERALVFSFDRDEFEKRLNFRVFETQQGIYISAPFGTVGTAVKVTGQNQRRVQVEDLIVDEKVRSRHA